MKWDLQSNGIGFIQNGLHSYAKRAEITNRRVHFDFTACRWVDPLPLMSMLLEIVTARNLGIDVDICLPEPDIRISPSGKSFYYESPNRFLRYFSQEGFLNCLDIEAKKSGGIQYFSIPPKGWKAFRDLQVRPSYEDALCVPMHLFHVPIDGEEFARDSVDILLTGIASRLESKVAPQTRERLISRIRVTLQEMLHNAQEHAYEPTDTSLADANNNRTAGFFKTFFEKSYQRYAAIAPGKKKFRFKNKLYSFDSSTIDLCLSVFSWANFRSTKGGIKLHALLDHDGYIPAFANIT